MKTLIVGPNLNVIGGISNFIKGLLDSFENNNVDVDYFDTYKSKGRSEQKISTMSKVELFKGLKVVWGFLLKIITGKYDKIIFNTSSYWGFYEKTILICIAKIFRINIILIVHGADFEIFYRNSNAKFLIRFVLGLTSKTLFVSREHKKYFHEVCKFGNFYHIDVPVLNVAPEENIKKYFNTDFDLKLSSFKYVYLSLSVLEPRKNVVDIISAFSKFRNDNSCLIVAGSGPLEMDIKNICNAHDNVFFVGAAIDGFKEYLFFKSDFLICNSERESFGITFIEAMLRHCIVISPCTGILSSFKANTHYLEINCGLDVALENSVNMDKGKLTNIASSSELEAMKYTWNSKFNDIYNVLFY
ncbi:glycosyltransferase family 4 protein [Vibrio fluvialis]|nr:glycosyltransferase family 4 protein [Vibrio fluvialis]